MPTFEGLGAELPRIWGVWGGGPPSKSCLTFWLPKVPPGSMEGPFRGAPVESELAPKQGGT